ncbi:MAG: DUF547 domain-containing protein [Planctomycetota bacterium]
MNKKEYSGPWLWLALASFAMPIGVAVWAFRTLPPPFTYPEIKPDVSGVDQGLWDHLLRTYVADGLIDYNGLKRTHLFKTYLSQLASAHPEKLPDDEHRLAFLCNAYNAFVINGVLVHKIDSSVLDYKSADGTGFFDLPEHILAGKTIDLNYLEHKVIREEDKDPDARKYNEPRIHVALVCAAKSCPTIRPEAFIGDRLDAQLEDQAQTFATKHEYVHFDEQEQALYLSPILTWYGVDFGGEAGVLDFLAERVESPQTLKGIQSARDGQTKIIYNQYDWSLNTQGAATASKANTGFGSGSIPNE